MLHIIFVYIILNPNTALTYITMYVHICVYFIVTEIVCILYCNINVSVLTHMFYVCMHACMCLWVCLYVYFLMDISKVLLFIINYIYVMTGTVVGRVQSAVVWIADFEGSSLMTTSHHRCKRYFLKTWNSLEWAFLSKYLVWLFFKCEVVQGNTLKNIFHTSGF